jgi:hypothetical protein
MKKVASFGTGNNNLNLLEEADSKAVYEAY